LVVTWPDSLFSDTNCNATEQKTSDWSGAGRQFAGFLARREKQKKRTKWIWASPWP
jgi:hypothetical protein